MSNVKCSQVMRGMTAICPCLNQRMPNTPHCNLSNLFPIKEERKTIIKISPGYPDTETFYVMPKEDCLLININIRDGEVLQTLEPIEDTVDG